MFPFIFSTTSRFLELPQTPRINAADALQFGHHLQVPSSSSQSTITLSPIFLSDATTMIDSPPVDIMLFQLSEQPVCEAITDGVCSTSKPVYPSTDYADISLFTALEDGESLTYESLRKVPSTMDTVKDDTAHLNPPDCSITSNFLPTDYPTTVHHSSS